MISKFAANRLEVLILNKVAACDMCIHKNAAANEVALADLHRRLSNLDPGEDSLMLGTVPDNAWEVLKNLPPNENGVNFVNNNVSVSRKKVKHIIDRRMIKDKYTADAVVEGIRNILNNSNTKHKMSEHYGVPIDTLYTENTNNMIDFMSIARNIKNKNPDVLTYYDFNENDMGRIYGSKK